MKLKRCLLQDHPRPFDFSVKNTFIFLQHFSRLGDTDPTRNRRGS